MKKVLQHSFSLASVGWLSMCSVTLSSGLVVNQAHWTKADHPPGVSSPTFTKPPQVSGHVAVSSPNVPNIFLFGGLTGPAGSPVTNSLYEYDVGGWREITPKEGPLEQWPRQRMYTAASILEDGSDTAMYMFGGWDPGAPGSGGEFLKDIWKLDLVTKTWEDTGVKLPFPVSRHAACKVGKIIVIHTYQGVLVFEKDGNSIKLQETTGDSPVGLSMCAQVPLGDSGVLIFGGSTKIQQLSDAAYYLDTTSWEWTKLETVGDSVPSARASPCGAPVHGSSDQAVIFGGASLGSAGYEGGAGLTPLSDAWLVTVDKMAGTAKWKQLAMSDIGPEARLAATLTCIYGEGGKRILLQGGYDSTSKVTFSDPWVLCLDN
ncbi:galactose oxidase [Nitzschia inconspicua]|uniref:Galactose oxidase n=1 Tax=Nitzschia inconspicua TaxID=303405 RepID=A0A9K3PWZ6_9STRA|nr:galactose oxidase [Nitzschia inconspicua]